MDLTDVLIAFEAMNITNISGEKPDFKSLEKLLNGDTPKDISEAINDLVSHKDDIQNALIQLQPAKPVKYVEDHYKDTITENQLKDPKFFDNYEKKRVPYRTPSSAPYGRGFSFTPLTN